MYRNRKIMIKKKSNAYKHIKSNISKLTIIQQATGISPELLATVFLRTITDDSLRLKKKTKEGYWQCDLSDKSPYKYLQRESAKYLKRAEADQSFQSMLEFVKANYLTKDYFGSDYKEVELVYRAQELGLKNFVREAFIATYPLTPEMTPAERAIRNQRLGKISVNHWIGDIIHYDYFNQAPGFMMDNVRTAISRVELYVMNLLHEKELDHDLMKLSTNQKLQTKLQPRQQSVKSKIHKI